MGIEDILLLGDPRLYQLCEEVQKEDISHLEMWKMKMHHAMEDIRKTYGFGRAIAAPQLGIMKRLIYMNIDQPQLIINPVIHYKSDEMMELWDDCMSFPNLLVRVKRHKEIHMSFYNDQWKNIHWTLEGDLSELLQHEVDHLDGILCTMRAIDNQSYKWRP